MNKETCTELDVMNAMVSKWHQRCLLDICLADQVSYFDQKL